MAAEPNKYWFARRFPVGNPRAGMTPISREGWIVVAVFFADLVIGGIALLFFGLNGQFVAGIGLFVVLAVLGGGMFIGMAERRGDKVNTADDYRAGRVKP